MSFDVHIDGSLAALADDEPERPLGAVARRVAGDDGHAPVTLRHGRGAAGAAQADVPMLAGAPQRELDPAASALRILDAPVDPRARLRGGDLRRRRVTDDVEGPDIGRTGIPREVGGNEPHSVRTGAEMPR